MPLSDLITADSVFSSLKGANKKKVFFELSERAAALTHLPAKDILEAVSRRESLGPTGIGGGVAIPHGKLEASDRIFGLFARLEKPIDYGALDGVPVDLIFLLLGPETAGADHLKALARIARALRNSALATQLRETRDPAVLFGLLSPSSLKEGAVKEGILKEGALGTS